MSAQTILVTGAGRGIGLSIVKQLLLQAPAETLVIAVDLNGQQLYELQPTTGKRLEIIVGDVSQRSTSEQAIKRALSCSGHLDSLILNAGILAPVGPIAETNVDEWKKLFDINFFALLHTIQLGLPELRRNHGKVIMTSSGVTLKPFKSWAPYACAKSAMNYLSGAITLEEQGYVSSVCISPGIVDTEMQAQVRNEHQDIMPADQYQWAVALKETGKLLTPDQPAEAFVRLALDGIPEDVAGQMLEWDDPRLRIRS